jgi:hypothetical protein
MTPEQFRAQFIKSRGLTINDSPIPQVPVQSVPIAPTDPAQGRETIVIPPPPGAGGPTDPNAPPFRLDRGAVLPPEGPAQVVPPITPGAAYAKPSAFPTGAAPAVPFNPIRDPGPAGVSLNSTPVAPGWAGTVGLPASPEESKGFDKGQKYNEVLTGLEQIAKGAKPKASGDSGANTITPMSVQPNAPSQVSGELMAQLLQHARRPRGLTLTGQ